MPFLGQDCVAHGQISQTGICCENLTPWAYDANSGQAYDGFGCWNAECAQAGQWAGPGGIGNRCCPGLTNVNGKCGTTTPGYTPPPPTDTGDWLSDFANSSTLIWVAGGALLLMMLGKKR